MVFRSLERRQQKGRLVDAETALKEAMTIDGALGAALVDWGSGMSLGSLGGGKYLDLEVAAAGNTEVIPGEHAGDGRPAPR
jgi:hypothetical protein